MAYHLNIKQGNLLEEKDATFIVNASNTRLLLGSGVSMGELFENAVKTSMGYL